MDPFLEAAIEEAKKGLASGGIPIGSVLVFDGKIIGRGHNQRVQKGSVIHHAEMNCLENAGRQKASVYQRCTLYSTLSPCQMCSGAALLYKIPRIVIGENVTFKGPEDYVRSHGVQLDVLQDPTCIKLMRDFIAANPELWRKNRHVQIGNSKFEIRNPKQIQLSVTPRRDRVCGESAAWIDQ